MGSSLREVLFLEAVLKFPFFAFHGTDSDIFVGLHSFKDSDISFLDSNFKLTEYMAYILLSFNTITTGVIMFTKHGDTIKTFLSPRSRV